MEDQKYYQLLKYLQRNKREKKKYEEWVEQFYEKGRQIYQEDKRLIP